MIPLSESLNAHLQETVTTHCFAWILRREDGVTLGFTDHDKPLMIADVLCDPQTGMSASEASTTLGLAMDHAEIEGALSSLAISESDIDHGLYDGAMVETYLVNWSSSQDHLLLRRSRLGKITRSDGKFIAELNSGATDLDKIHGRRVMRDCDAEFGDSRCGVNIANTRYYADGRVTKSGNVTFLASGLEGFQAGWFANGRLTWTQGVSAGQVSIVIGHTRIHDTICITLRDALKAPMSIGDQFRIIAGCDKSFIQCKTKFSNGINYRGFPHLPGNDAAYSYVDSDTYFDGRPLVP